MSGDDPTEALVLMQKRLEETVNTVENEQKSGQNFFVTGCNLAPKSSVWQIGILSCCHRFGR
jgi:hypothetical protein